MGKKHHNGPETDDVQPAGQEESDLIQNEVEQTPQSDGAVGNDSGVEQKELCEEDKLRIQVKELEDKLLRTAAEFENYKKRMARQYDDIVKSANDSIFKELLEIVDNFERALNHNNENTDRDAFRKGTELILTQMLNLLKKYDIEPIEAIGQSFDPNIHDAVMQMDTDEYDEGVVALEIARGYRQGQRVIRHSRVGVSTGKKKKFDS